MERRSLITVERDAFIRRFGDIVNLESPTQRKDLNDKLCDYLENMFQEVAQVERIPREHAGDNLRITVGEGQQQVLMLCHMDTVWDAGSILELPFGVKGDKIVGPGTYDMKFGIVQSFYVMKALKEHNIRLNYKLVLYINSDEETGSYHSEALIVAEAKKSKCVLVMEPSEETGYAKTQRKGSVGYHLKVHGKAAHAGAYHQDGVNAIRELSRLVLQIEAFTDYEAGTTANVGVIKGGSRTNVVPPLAEAWLEFRFTTQREAQRVEAFMAALQTEREGSSVEVIKVHGRQAFEKNEGNQRLYAFVKKAADALQLPMGEIFAGGLSDGNITSALGVPTIDGLGGIGAGSHSVDEYVDLPSIYDRMDLLMQILHELNTF